MSNILVLGGGLVGLAAAMMLARRGHSVRVSVSLTRQFVRRICDMSINLFNLWSANRTTRFDRNDPVSHDRNPPFGLERNGSVSAGFRKIGQRSSVPIDAAVWTACCVLTVLGLAKAATSEQPVIWVALWPAPVVVVSTVFTFLRQGFHFRDGVLVLGRRPE
jgi:hypothetical protein